MCVLVTYGQHDETTINDKRTLTYKAKKKCTTKMKRKQNRVSDISRIEYVRTYEPISD